jgi:hypothetical protein
MGLNKKLQNIRLCMMVTVLITLCIVNNVRAQNKIRITKINGSFRGNLAQLFSLDNAFKIKNEANKIEISSTNKSANWTKALNQIANLINKDADARKAAFGYSIEFVAEASNTPFLVGEQTLNLDKPGHINKGTDVFNLLGEKGNTIKNITITTNSKAKIKYIGGLYYGSFIKPKREAEGLINGERKKIANKSNKLVSTNFNGANNDVETGAMIGFCFKLNYCENVNITNLEIDGNIQNQIIGGYLSDGGIQGPHVGIGLYGTNNAVVKNINAHHFGLDALLMSSANNTEILNSNFEYNGRQGLSWVGGRGLRATNSSFSNTGKVIINGKAFVTPPAAGIDIEPESDSCFNGLFENCKILNNAGCALVNDLSYAYSGLVNNMEFKNCLFEDDDSYGVWVRGERYKFSSCNFNCIIYGAGFGEKRNTETQFINCNFSDKLSNNKMINKTFKEGYLMDVFCKNLLLDNCTFNCYDSVRRPMRLVISDDKAPIDDYIKLKNTNVNYYGVGAASGFLWTNTAILQGVQLIGKNVWTANTTLFGYHGLMSRNLIIGDQLSGLKSSFQLNGKTFHILMNNAGANNFTLGTKLSPAEYVLDAKAFLYFYGDANNKPVLTINKNSILKIMGNVYAPDGDITNYGTISLEDNSGSCFGSRLKYLSGKKMGEVIYKKSAKNFLTSPFDAYKSDCIKILGN